MLGQKVLPQSRGDVISTLHGTVGHVLVHKTHREEATRSMCWCSEGFGFSLQTLGIAEGLCKRSYAHFCYIPTQHHGPKTSLCWEALVCVIPAH